METELFVAIVGIVGTLVGAVVGAAASIGATIWTLRQQGKHAGQARADALRQQSFAPAQELVRVFGEVEQAFKVLGRSGSSKELAAAPDSVWTDERRTIVATQAALLSEEWARVRIFDVQDLGMDLSYYWPWLDNLPTAEYADLAEHGRLVASMHIRGALHAPDAPAVFGLIAKHQAYAEKQLRAEFEEEQRAIDDGVREEKELQEEFEAAEREQDLIAAQEAIDEEQFESDMRDEKPFSPESWGRN